MWQQKWRRHHRRPNPSRRKKILFIGKHFFNRTVVCSSNGRSIFVPPAATETSDRQSRKPAPTPLLDSVFISATIKEPLGVFERNDEQLECALSLSLAHTHTLTHMLARTPSPLLWQTLFLFALLLFLPLSLSLTQSVRYIQHCMHTTMYLWLALYHLHLECLACVCACVCASVLAERERMWWLSFLFLSLDKRYICVYVVSVLKSVRQQRQCLSFKAHLFQIKFEICDEAANLKIGSQEILFVQNFSP